jgi:hypothetical protein
MTCVPVFGPMIAGKFQFSGMSDLGLWTRKDHEEIEVFGGTDRVHPTAGVKRDGKDGEQLKRRKDSAHSRDETWDSGHNGWPGRANVAPSSVEQRFDFFQWRGLQIPYSY